MNSTAHGSTLDATIELDTAIEHGEHVVTWLVDEGKSHSARTVQALIDHARAGRQANDAAEDDELLALPTQPEELRARIQCEDCDGRGHDGEAHWQGHFQPLEPAPCGTCKGAGTIEAVAMLPEQVLEVQRKAREYQRKVDRKIIDRGNAQIAALQAQLASALPDAERWQFRKQFLESGGAIMYTSNGCQLRRSGGHLVGAGATEEEAIDAARTKVEALAGN